MANSNNWGEIYNSTWWGDKAWSANTLFIDSAPPGFGLNLLKGSEDLDNTIDWDRLPDTTDVPTVSANTITDPNGGTTAERVDFSANRQARLQQRVTLEASKQYTFSVYAKVNTGTQNFRLRNVTLGDAESKTATTSWTRFSYTFTTTTAGDYDISLQNNDNTARTLEFWGAMLNEGATAGDYVKTEASVSGSAPTPAYSGFGDAFGGVTAYYSLRQFTEAETLNAIRVRRSSDDTEQDIGFDENGDLDSTALLAFVNEDVEKIVNGDFATDSNWTKGTGWTISGGTANCDGTQTGTSELRTAVGIDIQGVEVTFSFEVKNYSAGTLNATIEGTGALEFSGINANGVYSTTATSSDALPRVTFTASSDFVGSIDDVSVIQSTADGAVTTFYDQSGNGNNATNATASEQPLVVSGGTLVEENGKAALEFDGVDDYFTGAAKTTMDNTAIFSVIKSDSNTQDSVFIQNSVDASNFVALGLGGLGTSNAIGSRLRVGGSTVDSVGDSTFTATDQTLVSYIADNTAGQMFVDGTEETDAVDCRSGGVATTIGARGDSNNPFNGAMQEVIFFNSDQSTNRTGIETNINDHFTIYP